MDAFTHAINSLLHLLVQLGSMLISGLVAVELWLRGQLAASGIAPAMQTTILLMLAGVLILGALRLFSGLIRAIVLLVLILVAIHILLPILPR